MRVPSVAIMAAVLVVVHAVPGQDSPPTYPSTPEIVQMFSEPAASAEEVEISESLEDVNDEAPTSSNYLEKRSYAAPPHPAPKQFCIEIRPKNPSQSPFVICEPPTQPYYQYPPSPPYPYPYKPAPPAPHYPPVHSAYSPPSAPPSPPHGTIGKPYQRSGAVGSDAAMLMLPFMGDSRSGGMAPVKPSVAPVQPPPQFPPPGGSPVIAPVLQPSPGSVMSQPMPPPAPGRSAYPQPYGSYDQTPPVTMQCHAQPGYPSYHGYQNPVALLQLFLKPSHHHHHHPGYYSPPATAPAPGPSYRAAGLEASTQKPKITPIASNATQMSASDNSTQGPLRVPIPIDNITTVAAHGPSISKGPHVTPDGSHPETKVIPGITAPGRPNPVFLPGGGAALLKPNNASTATLTAPKMSENADFAVNLVDGPPPMGRSVFVPAMMPPRSFEQPAEAWATFRDSVGGNDMFVPENHVITGQMPVPIHPDMASTNNSM